MQVKLAYVSASQVESYRKCPRYWYGRSVLKLPEPPRPAAEKGSRVHAATEEYLKTGALPEDEETRNILSAGLGNLPERGDDLDLELGFELPTWDGGPIWTGYIDLIDSRAKPVRIIDHKTISDFRYCKTPEELLSSTQMMSYARWYFSVEDAAEVEVTHLYLRTKRPYKAHKVSALATRKRVEEIWDRDLGLVREMVGCRERGPADISGLDPNTASCGMYGGCPFRSKCGLLPTISQMKGATKMSDTNKANGDAMPKLSLSERLAKKRAESGAAVPLPMPTVSVMLAPPAEGVVPPDAPPRNTGAAVASTPTVEEPKRRGRPKKDAAPVVEVGPAPIKAQRPVFSIYVDCLPVKGGEAEWTLFEDWIATYTKQVAESHGIADWRQIEYGKGKAALANVVRENVHEVPEVLIVSSYAPGVNEVLDVLIPHATRVVRALRG